MGFCILLITDGLSLRLFNLGFLTQNEICLADVLILGQTLTSGHFFYFLSYPAIYLEM